MNKSKNCTARRNISRDALRPKEWWIQHLSGLIGSGIGAYTAFTVFGGRRLMEVSPRVISQIPIQLQYSSYPTARFDSGTV